MSTCPPCNQKCNQGRDCLASDFTFQKALEVWGDKVVAPTHRVFQEWLHNPLTKALKESHKNDIEKLAQWMMERGYATGHADTIEDLLQELDWQIREQAEKQEPVTFVCSTGFCRFTLTQTNVGIGERGMQAYEEAKKRGWVGISDEMEMPKQEPK